VLPLAPAPPAAGIEPVAHDDRLAPAAHALLRMLLEVLDGRRPARQLADRLAPAALGCLHGADRGAGGQRRLASLRICQPAIGVGEVAAVYRLSGRARAVAARFECGADSVWRCVALRLG